jgi:hypothetical protein
MVRASANSPPGECHTLLTQRNESASYKATFHVFAGARRETERNGEKRREAEACRRPGSWRIPTPRSAELLVLGRDITTFDFYA